MNTLPSEFLTRPIAHRALHDVRRGRPENSRAAICAAMEHGYGIEMDLQLSGDGRAMVFHDYQLDRLTGRPGAVRDLSAQELGQITLLGGDEGIPTLTEVLDLVGGRVPLLIELKDQSDGMGQGSDRLERAVAADLSGYGGPVAVMSFNPFTVLALKECAPHVPRGLVTCGWTAEDAPELSEDVRAYLREIPDYARCGASFISHDIRDLDRPAVSALKAGGAHILCWTVRSPEAEARARRIAQNITFETYLAAHPR